MQELKMLCIYAVFEGLALGSISYFAERWYPGIVLSAIMLTIATALAVMMIYRNIRVVREDKGLVKIKKYVFLC